MQIATQSAGPRIAIESFAAPGEAALRAQLRRAVRALLGQRGGTMLLRAWGSGTEVRIECAVAGLRAVVAFACGDAAVADAVRRCGPQLLDECARTGCRLARIECSSTVQRILPAA